jgi:hypothetical protein
MRKLFKLLLAHRLLHLPRGTFKAETERSPRFADNAAPAAICCFFDFAGMPVTPC